MHVGDKIKYLRKKHHMTQADLARRLNVSVSSVSAWENQYNGFKMDKLAMIAAIFDVSVETFFDQKTQTDMEKETNIEKFEVNQPRRIPVLGAISCLNRICIEENFSGYEYTSSENLPEGNLFYVQVINEEMEPKIPKGSKVLVLQKNELEHGEIVAIRKIDEIYIQLKRVKIQGELVLLLPDNADYDSIVYTKDCGVEIIGQAIRYTVDL